MIHINTAIYRYSEYRDNVLHEYHIILTEDIVIKYRIKPYSAVIRDTQNVLHPRSLPSLRV